MLRCENVSFNRGEKTVLKSFNLTAEAGRILVLKGPNGSGKTTLLKILSGLLKPVAGNVIWQDKNIFADIEQYRANIQFIGHRNAINKDLTVRENIAFWAKLSKNPELVPPALTFMKMENIADMPCRMLSAGWQRRVALSRLMITNRDLWLLDEPFTNLDTDGIKTLTGMIEAKSNSGGIVVLSSHNEIALKNADNISLN